MTVPRYAIYAVPAAGHALWAIASAWLGCDPEAGTAPAAQLPDWLLPERWREITAEARFYGFHGTLKPPFALAAGRSAAELDAALRDFAAAARPAGPIALEIGALSGFLALLPRRPEPSLLALADRCVEHFDAFRAPPDEAELAHRRRAKLMPVQEAHLLRWGYPYVFDQFRYHMTLTGRLAEPERGTVQAWLTELFAGAVAAPVSIELALFRQTARDLPFRLIRRYPLIG